MTTPSFEIPDSPVQIPLREAGGGRPGLIGVASFTVTNRSASALSARLKAEPQGDAKAEWLSVQGERERPFGPGETQKIGVDFALPADAAGSDFKFRLIVMNVNDPGDDYTASSVVTFAAPAKAEKKPSYLPYILAAVALLAVVAGVIFFLLRKPSTPGTPAPEVLSNGSATASPTPTPSPAAATTRMVTVPPLKDNISQDAKKALAAASLTWKVITVDTNGDPNTVDGSDPAEGETVPAGSSVTLLVVPVPMPNVVSKRVNEARTILRGAGFDNVDLTDANAQGGIVVAQAPAAGRKVNPDAPILLANEAGVAVPNLIGKPVSSAMNELEGNFAVTVAGVRVPSRGDPNDGTVVSISPAPGARVPPGATVQLQVHWNCDTWHPMVATFCMTQGVPVSRTGAYRGTAALKARTDALIDQQQEAARSKGIR